MKNSIRENWNFYLFIKKRIEEIENLGGIVPDEMNDKKDYHYNFALQQAAIFNTNKVEKIYKEGENPGDMIILCDGENRFVSGIERYFYNGEEFSKYNFTLYNP